MSCDPLDRIVAIFSSRIAWIVATAPAAATAFHHKFHHVSLVATFH
jgi:hypothetical protein